MESVKRDMRKLCKQLSLDIKRRQEGHSTLDSIRHMMFTGNPGTGKTTVSRLVAKLYHQLGVSSKDTVVEVQKGDLVAGCVTSSPVVIRPYCGQSPPTPHPPNQPPRAGTSTRRR